MPLFVVNSTTDARGRRVPVVMPNDWVGNLYSKSNGNVHKYLMLTPADISGQAGVFGPITPEQVASAIEADNGTISSWTIDELPEWASAGWDADGEIVMGPGDG